MKNNSEFKIACSRAGTYHFAYVKIQVSSADRMQVINSIINPVNTKEAEIDETTHPDWFNSTVNGVQSALQYIHKYTGEKFTVEVNCIKGVLIDTRSYDVEAAAFLATIKAILGNDISYQLNWIDEKWDIVLADV
jgi:hypothetical protein